MNKMNLSFTWNSPLGKGVLSPDDLRFFYYDIATDNIIGFSKIYEWDDNVISFLETNKLTIEDCDIIEDNVDNNTIIFTIIKDKDKEGNDIETKPQAFFRHLRNAFAHYNIKRDNDFFYIRDINDNKTKMLGVINCDLLKQFCFLFLDQREALLQSLDNQTKLNNNTNKIESI